MAKIKLKVVRRKPFWWIVGCSEDVGPYESKDEAEEDIEGLEAFWNDPENADLLAEG